MRNVCTLLALASASLLANGSAVAGEDIELGRQLHAEHCLRCHGPEMYQRTDGTVTDLQTLRQRVSHCELGQELSWFPEEVDEVVAYLNATYYQFDENDVK